MARVDPRLVSTPLGAAIGLVLANKVLRPEHKTNSNLAIGAGLGAGAGFLTGQYLEGDPPFLSNGSGDPKRNFRDFVITRMPTGQVSRGELNSLGSDIFGNVPTSGGGPIDTYKRHLLKGVGGPEAQRAGHYARARALEEYIANNPGLSDALKQKTLSAISANRRAGAKQRNSVIWRSALGSGQKAIGKTIWDFMSRMMPGD